MKIKNGSEKGFSLTELLVVIAIIVVLAGLTIGAISGIQEKMNRDKVERFLAEIQLGLSRYETEHGNFPLNPDVGGVQSDDLQYRDSEGLKGSAILYQNLSGDLDENGEVDRNGVVYVPGLEGKSNETSKDKRVIRDLNGAGYLIVDSYNSPIRYLADPPNKQKNGKPEASNTMNPKYDLWSIVGTDPGKVTEPKVQLKYITNWTGN